MPWRPGFLFPERRRCDGPPSTHLTLIQTIERAVFCNSSTLERLTMPPLYTQTISNPSQTTWLPRLGKGSAALCCGGDIAGKSRGGKASSRDRKSEQSMGGAESVQLRRAAANGAGGIVNSPNNITLDSTADDGALRSSSSSSSYGLGKGVGTSGKWSRSQSSPRARTRTAQVVWTVVLAGIAWLIRRLQQSTCRCFGGVRIAVPSML